MIELYFRFVGHSLNKYMNLLLFCEVIFYKLYLHVMLMKEE